MQKALFIFSLICCISPLLKAQDLAVQQGPNWEKIKMNSHTPPANVVIDKIVTEYLQMNKRSNIPKGALMQVSLDKMLGDSTFISVGYVTEWKHIEQNLPLRGMDLGFYQYALETGDTILIVENKMFNDWESKGLYRQGALIPFDEFADDAAIMKTLQDRNYVLRQESQMAGYCWFPELVFWINCQTGEVMANPTMSGVPFEMVRE